MKVSKETKEKLIDVLSIIERLIRCTFYIGAGNYLALKACVVIPQHPDIPDILVIPAYFIATIGGIILAAKVFYEPTPKTIRKLRRRQEIIDQTIDEIIEEKKMWGK
jgi:hypothetical protein